MSLSREGAHCGVQHVGLVVECVGALFVRSRERWWREVGREEVGLVGRRCGRRLARVADVAKLDALRVWGELVIGLRGIDGLGRAVVPRRYPGTFASVIV